MHSMICAQALTVAGNEDWQQEGAQPLKVQSLLQMKVATVLLMITAHSLNGGKLCRSQHQQYCAHHT